MKLYNTDFEEQETIVHIDIMQEAKYIYIVVERQ